MGIVHTGSRADYAPERFAPVTTAGRAFSPPLRVAWPVVRHGADHDVEDDFAAALAAAELAPIDFGDGDGDAIADPPVERWITDPAGAG